jgi:methylaspartate ammonia-lyase
MPQCPLPALGQAHLLRFDDVLLLKALRKPPAGLIADVESFTKDGQALRELVPFDQQLAAQELSGRGSDWP